jgi:hypothetical protein
VAASTGPLPVREASTTGICPAREAKFRRAAALAAALAAGERPTSA